MTRSELQAERTKLAINQILLEVCGNPKSLAYYVASGRRHWHFEIGRAMAGEGLPMTPGILDSMYAFLCQRYVNLYGGQPSTAPQEASAFLDAYEEPSGPTDEEINAAWEIESGSSDAGRQHFYGRSSPEEVLDKLKQGARPEDLILQ